MEFPGEKLLIKMWETLAEKGVGGLLGPWQTRRIGKAQSDVRAHELLVIAQAEKLAQDIRSGRKTIDQTGKVIELQNVQLIAPPQSSSPPNNDDDLPPTPPLAFARPNSLAAEVEKEINVTKSVLHAEEALKNDPQNPSEKDIDRDWLFRWRNNASEVTSDELQRLWGRVLAGEVKSPGTFSLRTLEFLRNLSTLEAERIAKFLRFSIQNWIYKDATEIFAKEGITFSDLLSLQELSVINAGPGLGLKTTIRTTLPDQFQSVLRSFNRALLIKSPDPKKEIVLQIYQLTTFGLEVTKLGQFEPHEEYLRLIGMKLKNEGYEVSIGDVVDYGPEKMLFRNEQPL